MNKIQAYLQDVTKEMRKVSWPSRTEAINNTGITLLASLLVALVIYGADQLIASILELIYV